MKKEILIVFTAILLNPSVVAQQLITDSLFGVNGYAAFPIISPPECTEITDLQNGYFLVGGYNYDINSNAYYINIIKSDYCGDADSTFGLNGLVYHTFSQRNTMYDMQLQSDGKILSCGIESTSNAGSAQIPYVSRFNSNGSPDTTFGTMGSNSLRFDNISSGRFFGVRQLSDGRVVCTGYSTANINGGTGGIGAMRFTSNGILDSSFSSDGIQRYDAPIGNGLGAGFLADDNDIIAVGTWVDAAFMPHFMVTVWDSTGLLEPSFNTGGLFMDSTINIDNDVYAVRDSLGYITMAGNVTPGPNTVLLVRLTPAGFPDPNFGTDGYALIVNASIGSVSGIRTMPGGQYLILGTIVGTTSGFCMLLNDDGSVDTTFGNLGFMNTPLAPIVSSQYAIGMIELPNGQWIIGGNGGALNTARFATVSDVPHITQQFNYLETTGTGTYQWFLNGLPISGAVNDTLHFNQNGSYTVELTGDYGCSYLSDPYIVSNSSLNESLQVNFTVFPSPAENSIYFSNDTGSPVTVTLYDIAGKHILSSRIESGIHERDVSYLDSGVYFVQIDKSSIKLKLMKQ